MRNQLIVPNAELAINQLKEEIAAELGIELNGEQTSKNCGKVGGEMTKRLIELGKQQLIEMSQEQGIINVNYLQTNKNQVNPPTYDHLH